MGVIATEWTQVHPSFVEPGLVIQYAQKSDAFKALAGGAPQVKIGPEDKYVYMRRVDVRTNVHVGQQASDVIPSPELVFDTASAPTYLQRARTIYDHHETADVAMWGTSIVEAQRLAMRQAHFQMLRNSLLYGVNASNGEGLLNANGAVAVNLPADPNGATTVVTYDNGAMAFFLLSQLSAAKTRTMSLGVPNKFVIIGPQRILGAWEYQDIVQLTSFFRQGAGSTNTKGVVDDVSKMNGDEIVWGYDDTLIGQGAGGTDAVLIVMPEVKPQEGGEPNTNEFAKLMPSLNACAIQYMDVAAPIELPTPLSGGKIDVVTEMRATPGWAPRPEGVTIVSMQYQ